MMSSRQLYIYLMSLSKAEMRQLISNLRMQGIPVKSIRPYAYSEMPEAFHIFFHLDDHEQELDYFQLPPSLYQQILDLVESKT